MTAEFSAADVRSAPKYRQLLRFMHACLSGAQVQQMLPQLCHGARNLRTSFRRYWSLLSPGIIVIRRMILQRLKVEAERRVGHRRTANAERVAPVAAERMAR